ncbi:hypothetical protein PHISCL_04741 [Aspergillus sclerotialis]|uniref:Uncharacterized protein n=1 Tax=Aspergillus sclerotialis TaxID=2070753 RepID=A0A3A2ZIJ2_9EURO|nr:hypothetical protein PHISCL_04741 [Aspergillus sclerotialis]
MAHHGTSKHYRLTRSLKKRNYSEACHGEDAWQGPGDNYRRTWTASASSSGIGLCQSDVKHDKGEDDSAYHNFDLPRRQQTGLPQESPTKVVTAIVGVTDNLTQSHQSSTGTASNSDLSQTTIPTDSPTPPASSVSTDSGLSTLSPHVPDTTQSAYPAPTSPTTDTPTSTSLISTAPTTSNSPQSSPLSTPLFSSSGASSSTLTSSRSLSTPSPTSTSSSSTSSSSQTSDSTSSTDTSSLSGSGYTSSLSTDSGPTGFFGGFPSSGGGSGTSATSSIPGPTATNPPPQTSSPSPTTNKIVGGVVGSVAGVAFLFLVILLYLRRRHAAFRAAREGLPAGEVAGGAAGEGSVSHSAEMTSRQSSHDPLFASSLAPAFMRSWRKSSQTTRTDSTLVSNQSERGFQKIAGRKIPSVLQSGGDGYGGGVFGEASPGVEMSVNFQPSPPINIRPPASQPPTASAYGMPLDTNYTRENQESDPEVIVRPSPARTPTASSTNIPSSAAQTPPRSTPEPQNALSPSIPRRPDVLGRSHPSLDGSRGSRFTESI